MTQYLLDQSENTSWLIMAGQGFGIVLEMWKVTKTVNIRIQPTNGLIPYRIIFEDKHVLSETEAKTKEYDQVAFVPTPISHFLRNWSYGFF
jgi:hypothetical protein